MFRVAYCLVGWEWGGGGVNVLHVFLNRDAWILSGGESEGRQICLINLT